MAICKVLTIYSIGEEFIFLQILRGFVPRWRQPLWKSQPLRMQETRGRVHVGGGKEGVWPTHDWRGMGCCRGGTPISWSSKKKARCQIRWPDSLGGLSGRKVQVPFVHSGLVFPSVTHKGWTVSQDVGLKDLLGHHGTQNQYNALWEGILTTFIDFTSFHPLVWQSPPLGAYPTDGLSHVHEDRPTESHCRFVYSGKK